MEKIETPPMQLVGKEDLPNGLIVEFYDYSRQVAGDRWLVGLIARIPVPVQEEFFEDTPEGKALREEIIKAKGPVVHFDLKKERNFIDSREKDETFNGLLTKLKEHALSYIGHHAFARGVIRRETEELLKKRNWWK